jgi:hypothetical protein
MGTLVQIHGSIMHSDLADGDPDIVGDDEDRDEPGRL